MPLTPPPPLLALSPVSLIQCYASVQTELGTWPLGHLPTPSPTLSLGLHHSPLPFSARLTRCPIRTSYRNERTMS